jgi:hypothetical protein
MRLLEMQGFAIHQTNNYATKVLNWGVVDYRIYCTDDFGRILENTDSIASYKWDKPRKVWKHSVRKTIVDLGNGNLMWSLTAFGNPDGLGRVFDKVEFINHINTLEQNEELLLHSLR